MITYFLKLTAGKLIFYKVYTYCSLLIVFSRSIKIFIHFWAVVGLCRRFVS